MDFDVLTRIGDTVKRCIISQDTTELFDLLDPQVELRGFQGEAGDFSDAAASGEAPAKVVRGSAPVGRATEAIFRWLQHGSCIMQPSCESELRRRKAVAATGGSGTAAADASSSNAASMNSPRSGGPASSLRKPGGGAAAAPATSSMNQKRTTRALIVEDKSDTAASSSAAAGASDQLLQLSIVTATYGRPGFSLVDNMYVAESNKIVLIVRAVSSPPTEPKALQIWQQEKQSLFVKSRQTVNALHVRPPVLDFTFTGIAVPEDLLRVPPTAGKGHRTAPIETKKEVDAVNTDFQQVGVKPQRNLIRARNARGEEEAYEFTLDEAKLPAGITGEGPEVNKHEEALRRLAAELPHKYVADAVRVSSNKLVDASRLVHVMQNLVANFYLSISWLDLSCNQIEILPNDLAKLPLTTLYLHANHIQSWEEVRKVTALRQLTAVTLHGNEIANSPEYKTIALAMLLNPPGKTAVLKSFDFVALSKVDTKITEQHLRRNGGDALPSPRRSPRGTQQSTMALSSPRR